MDVPLLLYPRAVLADSPEDCELHGRTPSLQSRACFGEGRSEGWTNEWKLLKDACLISATLSLGDSTPRKNSFPSVKLWEMGISNFANQFRENKPLNLSGLIRTELCPLPAPLFEVRLTSSVSWPIAASWHPRSALPPDCPPCHPPQ